MSSKESLQEKGDLSKVWTDDGFDPNVYKLLKKSGYDFNRPVPLGYVVEAKPYGINKTQKKIQEQGGAVAVPKVGLGYAPPQPVRISGRRKDRQSFVQYIAAEETTEVMKRMSRINQSLLCLIDCSLPLCKGVLRC